PPEAVLHLAGDPQTRVPLVVRTRAHLPVDLRRQDHLVAPVLQGLAHDLLGPALAIDVSGVDEVDPGVERRMDHADALVLVGIAPGAEHHGSQAMRADLDTGPAKGAVFHDRGSPPNAGAVFDCGRAGPTAGTPGGARTGGWPRWRS